MSGCEIIGVLCTSSLWMYGISCSLRCAHIFHICLYLCTHIFNALACDINTVYAHEYKHTPHVYMDVFVCTHICRMRLYVVLLVHTHEHVCEHLRFNQVYFCIHIFRIRLYVIWMLYTHKTLGVHLMFAQVRFHPPSPSKFIPFCFGGFSSYENILYFTTRCGLFREQIWVIIEFRSSQLRPS